MLNGCDLMLKKYSERVIVFGWCIFLSNALCESALYYQSLNYICITYFYKIFHNESQLCLNAVVLNNENIFVYLFCGNKVIGVTC